MENTIFKSSTALWME